MPRKTTKKTTKKTTTKANARKNKVTDLEQTHGKREDLEQRPVTLDQIWGNDGLSKYNTLDENEYSGQLDEMSMSDIQNHAATIGIIPTSNRNNLTKKLVSEFRKHVASHTPATVIKSNSSQATSKEVLRILKEGQ
jgi:hypothetical protein